MGTAVSDTVSYTKNHDVRNVVSPLDDAVLISSPAAQPYHNQATTGVCRSGAQSVELLGANHTQATPGSAPLPPSHTEEAKKRTFEQNHDTAPTRTAASPANPFLDR